MCGICGFLSFKSEQYDAVRPLARMVSLMVRRGPDSEGTWTESGVALGFRRLAIIDPSPAGNQPFLSDCGRYVLIYNGEIYNYEALRETLISDGFSFRSTSDTEVLLKALIRWDLAALPKLSGMFAFAWYDRVSERLVVARDPFGVKPLYYSVTPYGLVFGSQFNQLLVHPWSADHLLQPDVLGLYLLFGHIPAPYGLFRGTFQLRGGTYLVATRGGSVNIDRFYTRPCAEPRLLGADATASIGSAIRNAVRRQLVSDVPIGVLLSGGIDSPLVAAIARRESGKRIAAFTIGFDSEEFDESRAAANYAQHLDLEHHVLRCSENDLLDLVEAAAVSSTEPFADPSTLPTLLVSRFARSIVKVALSGDGADELLWGYPRFSKILSAVRAFRYPRWGRYVLRGAAKLGLGTWPAGVVHESVAKWHFAAHSRWTPQILTAIAPTAALMPADFDAYREPPTLGANDVAQTLRGNELGPHLEMMLTKVDRASMHYGLEVRVPMLDLEVVEAAHRLHPSVAFGRTERKWILRELLRQLAPGVELSGPKRGFDVPLAEWLRTALRPMVEDLLLHRDPYPEGLFERAELAKVWCQHLQSRADHSVGLWHLIALQLWADHHLRGVETARAA